MRRYFLGRAGRLILVLAFVTLILSLMLAAAHADVVITVTPDHSTSQAQTANGYSIHAAGPAGLPLNAVKILLPSHGRPCGDPDQAGDPIVGGDLDTNFLVTTPGVIVTGRWVTFPDPGVLPLDLHLDLLTPPLGGCFYAGATAVSQRDVLGLAKGASIFNDQGSQLAVDGAADAPDPKARLITVHLSTRNGTNRDLTLATERLGAQVGFAYDSSTFGSDPRPSRRGVRWTWHASTLVPAGGAVYVQVTLKRPCGVGAANLRFHVESTSGLVAGTGNGVNVDRADC